MKTKRIWGIILIIAGIAMVIFSIYIEGEVNKGRSQIESAERGVGFGKKIFSTNKVTQEVGKGLMSPIQKKINEGKRDVAYYENMANMLKIGGIVLIVVGSALLIFSRKKRGS